MKKCDECDHTFKNKTGQEKHMLDAHREKKSGYSKPALKTSQADGIITKTSCLHEIINELNTLFNRSKSQSEKRPVSTIKKNLL